MCGILAACRAEQGPCRTWRHELAIRLNEVLPEGFLASADRDGIAVSVRGRLDGYAWTGQQPDEVVSVDPVESSLRWIAGSARKVLSDVQDVISETTRDPWPRMPGPERIEAPAGARVLEGALHCWYGDEHAPVLTLRPLLLSD